MACEKCYTDYISCGVDGIYVQGTLLPETDYTWILTTPMGAKYHGTVTTDADGFFVIDTSLMPNGMLNPYAGNFTLEVQTGTCSPGTWNDSAYCTAYTCIDFDVKNGDQGKNTLGCPCLEDPEGCCFPDIRTFTDVATLDITYTAGMVMKYGAVPTVQVWIYDNANRLVNMAVAVVLDANPATLISIDFGGVASGIVVIR